MDRGFFFRDTRCKEALIRCVLRERRGISAWSSFKNTELFGIFQNYDFSSLFLYFTRTKTVVNVPALKFCSVRTERIRESWGSWATQKKVRCSVLHTPIDSYSQINSFDLEAIYFDRLQCQ